MTKRKKQEQAGEQRESQGLEDGRSDQDIQAANDEFNRSRLGRLEAIANGADEERDLAGDDQWSDSDSQDEDPDDATADSEEAADEVGARLLEQEAVPAGRKTENGVEYFRVVVNGQERWRTLDELLAANSKIEAADEYLRSAKESAKNASRAVPSAKDERPRPDSEQVRRILHGVVNGEDDAIEGLTQVLVGLSAQDDPPLTAEVIDARLAWREAKVWFETAYAKELQVPELVAYAQDVDEQLSQEHPDMGFRDRLQKVGEATREHAKQLVNRLSGIGVEVSNEKEARKANIRSFNSAAMRPGQDESNEGEDYVSTIEQMAKARGQGRATLHQR